MHRPLALVTALVLAAGADITALTVAVQASGLRKQPALRDTTSDEVIP